MDKNLTLNIGKYLFAIPFLVFGIFHFMNAQNMAGMVPGFIPGGVFWVYLTGVALIAASVSVLIKQQVVLAMQLLALMLIIFVLTIHLPATINDMNNASNLLKDLALSGGALLLAAHASEGSRKEV
ncbi:MAG: DoxX family protein [Bacteroidota bacterium]